MKLLILLFHLWTTQVHYMSFINMRDTPIEFELHKTSEDKWVHIDTYTIAPRDTMMVGIIDECTLYGYRLSDGITDKVFDMGYCTVKVMSTHRPKTK